MRDCEIAAVAVEPASVDAGVCANAGRAIVPKSPAVSVMTVIETAVRLRLERPRGAGAAAAARRREERVGRSAGVVGATGVSCPLVARSWGGRVKAVVLLRLGSTRELPHPFVKINDSRQETGWRRRLATDPPACFLAWGTLRLYPREGLKSSFRGIFVTNR
ncbi:hypothetical protein FFA01_04800 [Frigoribacterium faeni]|uniref:Uncharacterized protein n=1 Tax=Frigoribacterium faeni TaxID=145483 RepID=A0ABQ0UPT5_9MICO|nr:hypothetical protein GCM10025699_64780 [Microbacterium flavescens]GEK82171.1 hypothetical protein FFA01_04800 [Frigoribacterium faeni]